MRSKRDPDTIAGDIFALAMELEDEIGQDEHTDWQVVSDNTEQLVLYANELHSEAEGRLRGTIQT